MSAGNNVVVDALNCQGRDSRQSRRQTMHSRENELDLVRKAVAGCDVSFEQLVSRYSTLVYSCAVTLCRCESVAQDLAQETLVESWRSLSRFDGRCRFSTWMIGILRNRFLKWRSKSNSRPHISLNEHSAKIEQEADSPVLAAQIKEDYRSLQKAISKLNPAHRLVIEARFINGARLEEIAVLLDCPLGTVKSRLHNGLEKLRTMNLELNLFGSQTE